MALVVFSAVVLSAAVPAAKAEGTPTSILVFTDKSVYNPFVINLGKSGGTPTYSADFAATFSIYVYAMVMNEKGLILKGREGLVTGTLVDKKEYRHTDPNNPIGATINNPGIVGSKTIIFKDDGSINGDIAGDGVYVAVVPMPENIGTKLVAPTDELLINITVTDPVAGSAYTDVLIDGFNCMNKPEYTSSFPQHVSSANPTSDDCVVCHRGYEHFFENKSGVIDYKYLDAHFKNATARSRVPNPLHSSVQGNNIDFSLKFRWNMSDYNGAYGSSRTLEDTAPGSSFCYFCHMYNYTVPTLKYGNQRSDLTKVPSCNNSNCHTNTKIGGNLIPNWTPAAAASVATNPSVSSPNYNVSLAVKHAHDPTGQDTVPCAACHTTVHGLQIPNSTSTDYTDLASRCLSCHQLLNKHNGTVSCIKCHEDDVHNIRFLQQNLSYSWNKQNAVTCDDCHTNRSFAGALGLNPPQVPYTNHSEDLNSGQKWGDYWTSDSQQLGVGNTNLIKSSIITVSSESAQYGNTTGISGAQAVDGSYETLTEGTKSVPPTRVNTSVTDNYSFQGTITNWAQIQNWSDNGAYGTYTENYTGAGWKYPIVNGNFSTDLYGWSTSVSGASASITWWNSGRSGGSANISDFARESTVANITQSFNYIGNSTPYANLTFAYWADTNTKASSGEWAVYLTKPDGTKTKLWSTALPTATGGIPWTTVNLNLGNNISKTGTYTLDLSVSYVYPASGYNLNVSYDDINLSINSTNAYVMDIQNTFSNTPPADNLYLQTNYSVVNDTYTVWIFNGTAWNNRTVLNSPTFVPLNLSLTADEYNSGSPLIEIDDNDNNITKQGKLYLDYLRIYGWTADTSHQEIIVYYNFTGVPKYAAKETADYKVAAKGYVANGETLDIYAYAYDSGEYELVKDAAFSTADGWANWTMPYEVVGTDGNVSLQFRDDNRTRYDNIADNFYIDYVGIKADSYKFLPCYYCHALLANHKPRAIGNIAQVQSGPSGQNQKNSTDFTGYWCANCHYNASAPGGSYKYNGSAWSPVSPLLTINNVRNNSGSWYDHSSVIATNFTDAKCKECHGGSGTITTKDFPHTVAVASSGGANCTACHNLGGSAGAGKLVNFSAMNDPNAIHKNLNSGAVSPSGYPSENFKCWACHGNGSEPSAGGHPSNYNTPYRCEDCHVTRQNLNYIPNNTLLNVTEHYWNGTDIDTAGVISCYSCHNRSEMMVGLNLDPDGAGGVYGGANGGNNSSSHYGSKRSNLGGYSQNTNGYCNYCHNTSTGNATFYVSDFNNTIYNHSARATTPLCSNCHGTGRLHNSTLAKPVSNDAYCSTCHGPGGSASTNNKVEHKTLYCTECHANNTAGTLAGKDIHAVKYLTKSNTFSISNSSAVDCVTCHQTTAVDSSLSGFSAFKIINPMRHSDNISNGSVWDGYWTNTSPQTACIYCHSSTLHNATPLGRILQWAPNYKMYGNIGSNITCSDCHYKGDSSYTQMSATFTSAGLRIPPEITNGTNWKGNFSNYYNHSLDAYDDTTCKGCHGSLLSGSANMTEFMHNAAVGVAGGANCTACHNVGGSAGAGKLVNFTAMNDSLAIHKNLNAGASSPSSYPSENFKCWACHGNGSEPSSHPANYRTPYNCTDCHVSGARQNMNFTPSSILNVTQHYWNGTNISTGTTSCYSCHNRTEMMVGTALDPDGSGGVYSGSNGGNNSVSHYGKKRNDMAGWDANAYCNYCHNTTTNNATFYVSNYNNTIFNHSARATTPLCTTCHNNGRLHNSTLSKPVSNDSYCSTCHGPGGSALTNNKAEHKTLYCTECHANSSVGTLAGKDIHAVKYLTQSNTFSTTKSNAVNCVTCHQTSNIDSSLSGFMAFKITNPMHHSDNASNGSVWGSYWTNTSPQTACIYCHSNTTHNTTPLGRILQWAPNYGMYGSIGSNLSCSDCHYKGDANYSLMSSTFTSAGLSIPPEITNGTNWSGRFSNYYNHSLGSFTDQDCKSCHGSLLSTSANMSEFTHNAATGATGGANCTACHNIGGSAGSGDLINFTAANDTNAIHKNLNNGVITSLPAENKKCWACHGNGSEPSGHPSNYRTPYNCVDCHVQGTRQNMNFTPSSILNVTQHYWNGTSIDTLAAATCYDCHNKSEMMLGSVDPDGPATVYGGANGGNSSTSHYGRKRTDYPAQGTNDYCYKCHSNASAPSVFPYINSGNATVANHSLSYPATNPACSDCHASGRLHNDTLYKPAFALPNSTYCLQCHGSGGSATVKNLERHNSTSSSALNCTQCHLNSTQSIHPARYLQQNLAWDTSRVNAVNCATCHQAPGLSGFGSAPITPKPMNHSTDAYSGALWNGTQQAYWINTSQQSSCDFCHGKIALHNGSGLGNITKANSSSTVRQNLDNSRWCANCHYKNAPGYAGTAFSPEPPEILNMSGKVPARARDGTNFYNHSSDVATGYNDSKCKGCHNNALNASATSLNFSHNLAPGGGGPNCTACHYAGASVQNVDVAAMNDVSSIHVNLNKGASASDAGYSDSKKCWACHGDGTEPSGHPARYKTPYNCTDCHVQGGGQNFNYTPAGVLNVTQHYWSGSSIRTPNATSCYVCHNATGMIIAANDPDGASSNVYGGANGGSNSVSHYGKKRNDMAVQVNTTPYCNNCHSGPSAFPFIDNANRTIANHSLSYPATNPTCRDCHDGGRLHNSSMYKVSLSPLPNATYCTGCHGPGGSAGKNNLERHNGTGTSCSQCHLNASDSIHPARYLQRDNTWSTSKANAVNCTSCHQGAGIVGFGSAPKVPILAHSTNPYSGALWNGSQPGFWDNTSQQSSCDYCHGKIALHNVSGLGNITKVKGSNAVRQGFTGGYWCANCHYKNTASYSGNQFTAQPPEVLNLSGLVPPAARDGTQFYNHSTDLASGWDDAKCKTCHNNNLGAGATSANFTHSLGYSSGGSNCTACHGLSGNLADGKRVNETAMNSSLAIHRDLNKNAQISDANYSSSRKCWACHGDGTEPGGHPARYKTPYTCTDCHVPGAGQNMNYNPNSTLLNVTQHYWNGTSVGTANATSCYVCHNKTEMMVGITLDPDGGSIIVYGGANGGNNSVSHYGRKRSDMAAMENTTYCNYCHSNQSSIFPFASSSNKTIANHSTKYASTNPTCADCHASGRLHNSTVYKPAFDLSNGTYCLSCHGNNGAGGTNYTRAVTGYKEEHNGSLCNECHLNSTQSIHPVRYLKQNGTWSTANGSTVNCTSCHQGSGMSGFGSAPLVQTPIWHSNNTYSGALWNGTQPRYWDNTSQQSSCDYCHGNASIHNTSGLGKSVLIQGTNLKNQSLAGSYWCANCHYKGAAPSGNYNYKGNLLSPVPPEIFNLTGLVPANASDGMPFQNHTTNIGGDWSDTRCKNCHGKDLPIGITSATFVHKLNKSAPETGGPDCLKCHASTATMAESDNTPLNMRMNKTAFINYGVHRNMNINATSTVQLSDNRSKVCWACHGDGTQPIKHGINYMSPKPCIYCHVSDSYNTTPVYPYNATPVYRHYPGSVFIGNTTYDDTDYSRTCVSCHNNSIVANLNLTFDGQTATKIKNSSVSHYAINRSQGESMSAGSITGVLPNTTDINGCRQCHNVSGGSFGAYGPDYGNARTVPYGHNDMGSTPIECENACHNSGPVPVDLHNNNASIYASTSTCYSPGCHPSPTSGGGGPRR